MFDFLSCAASHLTPAEVDAVLNSEAFAQWRAIGELNNQGRAAVRGYRGMNLSLHVAKGHLRISGSLPTFAQGHNVHLLPHPEATAATAALALAVGLPTSRLIVKGVELSTDLDLPVSPRPFLDSLVHHRQSVFCALTPPKGVARPWEYYATHGNYRVKYYDKGAWAAHQGTPLPAGHHKLRYEVVCTRARPINALLNQDQVTLADLTTPDFYNAAADELRKHWKLTVRRMPLDFTGLKLKDSMLLQSGASPEFWRGLKQAKTPQITIKRQKTRYKELVATAQQRAGMDVYNERFPGALAEMLATISISEIDTILHTCNQVEITPVKEKEEARPFPTAEGLLRVEQPLFNLREEVVKPARTEAKEFGEESERKEFEEGVSETPTPCTLRCCQTCGRPLSGRSALAKFCSERELGKAAKKCRNAASNPRNNARRRLLKIESEAQLFDSRPYVKVPEQIREFVLAA